MRAHLGERARWLPSRSCRRIRHVYWHAEGWPQGGAVQGQLPRGRAAATCGAGGCGRRQQVGGGVQTALAAPGCWRHRAPTGHISSPLRRLGGEVQQASSSRLCRLCATCCAGGRRFLCLGALQGECCCFWPCCLVQGGVAPLVFVASCILVHRCCLPKAPGRGDGSSGTRRQRQGPTAVQLPPVAAARMRRSRRRRCGTSMRPPLGAPASLWSGIPALFQALTTLLATAGTRLS